MAGILYGLVLFALLNVHYQAWKRNFFHKSCNARLVCTRYCLQIYSLWLCWYLPRRLWTLDKYLQLLRDIVMNIRQQRWRIAMSIEKVCSNFVGINLFTNFNYEFRNSLYLISIFKENVVWNSYLQHGFLFWTKHEVYLRQNVITFFLIKEFWTCYLDRSQDAVHQMLKIGLMKMEKYLWNVKGR